MGRKIPGWQVAMCLIVCIGLLAYSVFRGYGEGQMPLLFAAAFSAIVAMCNGWKWSYLEKGMVDSVNRTMGACLILLMVGILVATWKAGGIIPTLIYYGLRILNPHYFLVTAALLCSLVSLVTGSSYTTAGTIGVALIGISLGLGINPAMTAGAVISGAYFGDKMSPMSDTTNLAPAVAGANIFDHVRHMVYTVTPGCIIMLVILFITGRSEASMGNVEITETLYKAIQDEFVVSPLLVLPVILLLAAIVFRVPALPAMFLGSVMGLVCMGAVQKIPFSQWFRIMHYGYESTSDIPLTDSYTVASIVGGGGFDGMLWTISICFVAMCFAGTLECTGMLSTISDAILKRAKTRGGLVVATIVTCFVMNCCTGDQYVSIIIPGRIYKKEFEDRKLRPKNLSRCLEDCATLTSPLVPWNVCGLTMAGFLGIPTVQYFRYCYLNLITPIVSIIYGYTGFTMEEMTDEEYRAMLERRLREQEDERRAAAESLGV